MEKNFQESK